MGCSWTLLDGAWHLLPGGSGIPATPVSVKSVLSFLLSCNHNKEFVKASAYSFGGFSLLSIGSMRHCLAPLCPCFPPYYSCSQPETFESFLSSASGGPQWRLRTSVHPRHCYQTHPFLTLLQAAALSATRLFPPLLCYKQQHLRGSACSSALLGHSQHMLPVPDIPMQLHSQCAFLPL